ncbi:DUF262 domain-containing protein [Erwinia aphidicola]|uniref:DUF262 domain-containing protein n=1 Tax=Erwinia aphidicola TaxID=68334 RepID=UPI00301AA6D3
MLINANSYSINEILEMLERRDLLVNSNYQRGSGLWPDGPCSYFIDTILESYPFPKIYMFEYLNRSDRKTKREIVDGQQRITTIQRFVNNEFKIRGDSRFSGKYFDDLDEEVQDKFLSYSVSADVIRSAKRSEILQMFRRMNAYTLPLNNAEKRHSTHIGDFKWFINEISDELNEFFVEFGVFTDREIIRMKDAEFISECVLAIEKGNLSSSSIDLSRLYQQYDEAFPKREEYTEKLKHTFEFIIREFEPLRNTFMMKSYALHSLITALITARYGNENIEQTYNITPLGQFSSNPKLSLQRLQALAQAHEGKEFEGRYSRYVWATDSSTNKGPRREVRVGIILEALGVAMDDNYDCIF